MAEFTGIAGMQVTVDGVVDEENHLVYFGKATRQKNGTWLAIAGGYPRCFGGGVFGVECMIREVPMPYLWEGDNA